MTYAPHNYWTKFFQDGDDVFSATDVDVKNKTDIDLSNDVDAQQNTVVEAKVGFGSSAIVDEAMNASPLQSGVIGNFDGEVATGGTGVEAVTEVSDGPSWFGWGYDNDRVTTATDVDVFNKTDIDLHNDVTAIQNTVLDLDVGPHSSAIISESMNAAPQQHLAVGNFGGDVETGGTEVIADDFIA